MSFFDIDGLVVPVAMDSVSREFMEIGDRARTFDGVMRETIRGRVSQYKGKTVPMPWADASSVFNALNASTQPQNCSGTMLSSGGATTVTMNTRAAKSNPIQSGTNVYFTVEWVAEESS